MSRSGEESAPAPGGALAGPPWILGLRGAPREAPENTLASLARALERGLAGVAYEVRRCASGEPFLLADPTLERTTDLEGPLAERTLPELGQADAGGWFGARFRGERLATLAEALTLAGGEPLHLVLAPEPGIADELVAALGEAHALAGGAGDAGAALPHGLPRGGLRVAARARQLALELRDHGLEVLLWLERLDEEARRFVADEHLAGVLAPMRAWREPLGKESWRGERWVHAADQPDELLDALRMPAFGLATSEPERARTARALLALAAEPEAPWPLSAPELPCEPGAARGLVGDWSGRWEDRLVLANPLGFDVRATIAIAVRRGAFEIEHLPLSVELAPGERVEAPFRLSGGSRSPGGDPLALARLTWRAGPGRPAGELLLDAPLARVRGAVADGLARRLSMLRESPGQREASMTLRRRGGEIVVAIEDAGGLADLRTLVHLDGRLLRGARAVRAALPAGFDAVHGGIPFSCGFEGRVEAGAPWQVRRWAGGLPDPIHDGAPGRLVPLGRG